MKRVFKRTASLMLALIMILSCMNGVVLADNPVLDMVASDTVLENEENTFTVTLDTNGASFYGTDFELVFDPSVFTVSGTVEVPGAPTTTANLTPIETGAVVLWYQLGLTDITFEEFLRFAFTVNDDVIDGYYTIGMDNLNFGTIDSNLVSFSQINTATITIKNGRKQFTDNNTEIIVNSAEYGDGVNDVDITVKYMGEELPEEAYEIVAVDTDEVGTGSVTIQPTGEGDIVFETNEDGTYPTYEADITVSEATASVTSYTTAETFNFGDQPFDLASKFAADNTAIQFTFEELEDTKDILTVSADGKISASDAGTGKVRVTATSNNTNVSLSGADENGKVVYDVTVTVTPKTGLTIKFYNLNGVEKARYDYTYGNSPFTVTAKVFDGEEELASVPVTVAEGDVVLKKTGDGKFEPLKVGQTNIYASYENPGYETVSATLPVNIYVATIFAVSGATVRDMTYGEALSTDQVSLDELDITDSCHDESKAAKHEWFEVNSIVLAENETADAGVHNVVITLQLREAYQNDFEISGSRDYTITTTATVKINPAEVEVPSFDGIYTYGDTVTLADNDDPYEVTKLLKDGVEITAASEIQNAGAYTVTYHLKNSNYIWKVGEDTTSDDQTVTLKIEKKKVTPPSASDVQYCGCEYEFLKDELAAPGCEYQLAEGTSNKFTNVGTYKVYLVLKDKDNTEWDTTSTFYKKDDTGVYVNYEIKPVNISFLGGAWNNLNQTLAEGFEDAYQEPVAPNWLCGHDTAKEEIILSSANCDILYTIQTGESSSQTFSSTADLITWLENQGLGTYTGTVTLTGRYDETTAPNEPFTGSQTKDITINIVTIAFTEEDADNKISAQTTGEFGTVLSDLFTNEEKLNDGVYEANVAGTEVEGTYKLVILDKDNKEVLLSSVPAVGTYTWKVVFTSTPVEGVSAYEDIPVAVNGVNVGGNIEITAKSLSGATVTGAARTYNGTAQTTVVTVTLDGKTLVEDTDYTVAYSNNTDAGPAKITVTGQGNYSGTASGTFTINPANLSSMTIAPYSSTYTGTAVNPATVVETVKGVVHNNSLTDADYDLILPTEEMKDAGEYTFTATGKGNYTGSVTATYTITAETLNGEDHEIKLSPESFTYNGKEKKPTVTIEGLEEGKDFTVKYSNNINATTETSRAVVTVTGKGNYQGTLTANFEIAKATTTAIKGASVSYRYNLSGNYSAKITGMPEAATYELGTIDDAKGILKADSVSIDDTGKVSFELVGKTAYEAGQTATIPVTVKMANYKDVTVNVVITLVDKLVVNVDADDITVDYTGEALDVVITGTAVDSDGNEVEGTWSWKEDDAEETMIDVDVYTNVEVIFTPTNTSDYMAAEDTITVTIEAIDPTPSIVDTDEDGKYYVEIEDDDETLADVLTEDDFDIDGTLTWYDEDGNVIDADTEIEDDVVYTWVFIPDSDNYNEIEGYATREGSNWIGGLIGAIIGGSGSTDFDDVPSNAWYAKAVDFVVGRGLFNGVSDDEFNPNGSMTRAMLVTVLWRLEGKPVVAYPNSFRDVADGTWYDQAVTWASANGLVKGYDAYTFGPNNLITREQMATILYRYAEMRGFNTTFRADLSKYSDAGSISGYAREAMSWAVEIGLISGMTETTLESTGTATRAQVATILMRFVRWYGL